jgi:Putative phage abortive infection protein
LREAERAGAVIANGRDCFRIFYNYLENAYRNTAVGMPANTENELLQRIDAVYSVFYQKHEKDVGHYFRGLYNLIKFVDRSDIEHKRLYTNLVRAQLSSFELRLLFYNCLSNYGREKFKPLIEKYGLLKTINIEDLLHGDSDKEIYNAGAFEGAGKSNVN